MTEATKMSGPLGLKMSDEDQSEYLKSLLTEDGPKLEGMELQCLDNWKSVTQAMQQQGEELKKARAAVAQMEGLLQAHQGQRQAYVTLLIAAEEGRRNAANPNLSMVKGAKPPEN